MIVMPGEERYKEKFICIRSSCDKFKLGLVKGEVRAWPIKKQKNNKPLATQSAHKDNWLTISLKQFDVGYTLSHVCVSCHDNL